jgi:hypothetical protein
MTDVLFILISDIDKSYMSWFEWKNYNSTITYNSDFVKQLENYGKVFIPQPNFINFLKYYSGNTNSGYDGSIYFKIEDLDFDNYVDWIFSQISEQDKTKKWIVIGYNQGSHYAKYFANKYFKYCTGLFILEDRIFSKVNFEKLWKSDIWYDQLKQTFGEKWLNYDLDNMTNERLKELLDRIPRENILSEYLGGFVKGIIRSQYHKIDKLLVPSFIYMRAESYTKEKEKNNNILQELSPVNIEFYYLDEKTPHFIYSQNKDIILDKIKEYIHIQKGAGKIVIHISGCQGSGKSTIGKILVQKYGDKIIVKDLDDLRDEFSKQIDIKNYNEYINNYINYNKKPIILTGLTAEKCLGLMNDDNDTFYEIKTKYRYFIHIDNNEVLRQRFYRQIDKLVERKEYFFNEWLINKKIQNKLFRFINLSQWEKNNIECIKIHKKYEYIFLNHEEIINQISKILD